MVSETLGPLIQSANTVANIAAQTTTRAWPVLSRIVQRKLRIIALIKADFGGGAITRSNSPTAWIPPSAQWLNAPETQAAATRRSGKLRAAAIIPPRAASRSSRHPRVYQLR